MKHLKNFYNFEKLFESNDIEQIKKNVMRSAEDNFYENSDDYSIVNGKATLEAIKKAQELATRYYEHRNDDRIKRDTELGITKKDYIDWVMSAFSDYVSNNSK